MALMTSAEGTTSSIFQPLLLPTSMNSMKRRMYGEPLKWRAIGTMSWSFWPRLTTMLILIGPRPTSWATSIPRKTFATFKAVNDVDFPVATVLRGIEVAHEVGLGPIKINMVVKRGQNDQDIVPMARHFKGSPYILRFIEFMDVGTSNGWKMGEVVPSAEVISRINAELPLEEVAPNYNGETSVRWRYRDGSGEIGVISSVTQSFCHSCTRVRVSTDGKLFTCLFATGGHDLRALLRGGCSDEQLSTAVSYTH